MIFPYLSGTDSENEEIIIIHTAEKAASSPPLFLPVSNFHLRVKIAAMTYLTPRNNNSYAFSPPDSSVSVKHAKYLIMSNECN